MNVRRKKILIQILFLKFNCKYIFYILLRALFFVILVFKSKENVLSFIVLSILLII